MGVRRCLAGVSDATFDASEGVLLIKFNRACVATFALVSEDMNALLLMFSGILKMNLTPNP